MVQNRIRELREERKMTQVRLSIELEISQETVSAYEREAHYPSYESLVKMRSIFHASIDYILGLSDIRNPVRPTDFTHSELLLIENYRILSEQKRDLLFAYLQGMLV